MPQQPAQKRSALCFKESTTQSFRFLLELGFRCVEANDYVVRYESSVIFVMIAHDRQSYEIAANVGFIRDPETYGSVEEIARLDGAAELGRLGNCEAASPGSVVFLTSELGKILRNHGIAALHGSKKIFDSLKDVRSRAATNYTQSLRIRSAVTRAESAWKRKDYGAVVEILQTHQEWLSDAQAKRLAYARKHMPKTSG